MASRVAFFAIDTVTKFGTQYHDTVLYNTQEEAALAYFKGQAKKLGLRMSNSLASRGVLYRRQHASGQCI